MLSRICLYSIITSSCIWFSLYRSPLALAQKAEDSEVSQLKAMLEEMKRDYDTKLKDMEEKIADLEWERAKGEWVRPGSPPPSTETVTQVRPVAQKEAMTEAEKKKLEEELKELMGEAPKKEAPAPPAVQPSPVAPPYFGGRLQQVLQPRGGIFQTYNPDISVIGDFLGTFVRQGKGLSGFDVETNKFRPEEFADRFAFREVELGLQAALDPYARGDFFLSLEDAKEISLEEGYITWLTMPWGLQPRIGRFRSSFGKVNKTHRPETFQIDYPKVVKNFLGPEGLKQTGLSLSWLVPNPWDKFIELTGEVSTPGDEKQFYVAHLKNFFDLTPNSSLEIGLSGGWGDNPGNNRQDLAGLDITYRWKPITYKLRPYKSFLLQGEAIFANQGRIRKGRHDVTGEGEIKPFNFKTDVTTGGAYLFGEYQLSRRHYVGLRFDYSGLPTKESDFEVGISPYWTFWQSDFVRLRAMFTHDERRIDPGHIEPFGSDGVGPGGDDIFQLQATWSMGVHRPHPF